MNTLVVYESFFGNTEKIAQTISKTLSADCLNVVDLTADKLNGTELLVMGSPTRGFRPAEKTVAFVESLPTGALKGIKIATFDTGIATADIKAAPLRLLVKAFGYAAKPLAASLVKKGATQIGTATSFWVLDREGPLKEGELDRAAAWAAQLLN